MRKIVLLLRCHEWHEEFQNIFFALQYNICFIIICTCDFFLYIKLKKCNNRD
uniref:Uncharacterized protein n=1 Tax=Anguilla anguilla TaxID=7936 RepID=A0A0E9RD05_ANGAN